MPRHCSLSLEKSQEQQGEQQVKVIRILPREDLPRYALETDELVQILGDIRVAQKILFR
jgi:hypothetical protein